METPLMIDNRRKAVKNLPAPAPSIIKSSLLAFWWHIKYQSPSRNLELIISVEGLRALY